MITPRPYQIDALNALWNYFARGETGNPIIAHPTASGKSLLPAIFISEVLKLYPNQRFLLVTHVSTLIKQNAEELLKHWPECPLGIYSAGLHRRDTAHSVIYGTIQSMVRNAASFGFRDMVWVDEAHLIGDNDASQYQAFFAILKAINPKIRIVGMSATPYRQGMGRLTEGKIFTDIVHDLTDLEGFNKLLADGYLSPLIPKRTHVELDVSNVKIQNGDYIGSQLEKAVNVDKITYNALQETIQAGYNRRSWMIFASGIDHAENISDCLGSFGIDCVAIHSKKSNELNTKALDAWKNLDLRSVVSFSKLTTGINNPYVDLIDDLRPTISVSLHVQKLGRGTRIAEGKQNCLVLDHARNVPRLGCINDIVIPKKRDGKPGDVPVKICNKCGTYNHTKVRYCTNCGNEFEFQVKIVAKAGTSEIIKSDLPIYETFEVDKVYYSERQPKDTAKAPYIKATYHCGLNAFSENVFPEGRGYAKHLFHQWWITRNPNPPPTTASEVLQFVSNLRCPKRITVHVNVRFPTITSCEY